MRPRLPFQHPNCKPHNWAAYELNHRFLEQFRPHIKGRLYDLGCGEAPYRDWLLQSADAYVGVDWGNTLHKLQADVVADLNGPLPIEEGAADSVISLSVMEHLREPESFLREIRRILRPGGVVILQVPFMWWVHEAPHDYFRYTRHGLEYLFGKAGLVDTRVYPMAGFWVMWTLKFNYQSCRLVRGPRPVRTVVHWMLRAVWAIDQRVALWLDRRWQAEEETAGYYVTARRAPEGGAPA